MSHGIRVMDIAWQAFQAGVAKSDGLTNTLVVNAAFKRWWEERERQGCALPACEKCGHDPRAKVVADWMFVIERSPPSLNDRLVNAGPRAEAYRKMRDTWGWEIRAARLKHKIPKATARRRVTLTRIYAGKQRALDVDNMIGGMKMVVDSIVHEGLITGDDPASVEINYQQERRGAAGLIVLIEELA